MRGRGSMVRLTIAVAAVMLLAAACADEDGSDVGASGPTSAGATGSTAETTGSTGTTGDDATGSTSGNGGGRYDYGDGGDDGGDGGGGDADLSIDNFSFSPATIEVASGTELVVENANGSTPHTFTVEGTDIDLELDPGDVEDVTIDLAAGTYDFVCRFHPQMTGTLTVA